ncbi:MAG: hypothetical protein M3Y48_23270 [Actinomycetota bacterium]|nr:hypothetical protein [Actinomycetota bacterium]
MRRPLISKGVLIYVLSFVAIVGLLFCVGSAFPWLVGKPRRHPSAAHLSVPSTATTGPFAFLATTPDGRPVTYDRCRPIHYVVNPAGMPPGGTVVIRDAVGAISTAIRLKFIEDGLTQEPPNLRNRPSFQPHRYGQRWAPVLIAWADQAELPISGGDIAGIGGPTPSSPRPRLGRWVDVVTIALGTWLLVGVFVDGWAHNNLRELETFFTPWHALLYSGFVAVGAWIMWQLRPAVQHGRLNRAAVPLGYGLGAVGVGIFAVGGVADLAWHEVFGIEQDIQALFSPTHLTLFLGIVLIMSTPLRAAWADPRHDSEPRYGQFVPVIWSATMTAAMTAFFFMYWAAFNHTDASRAAMTVAADRHLTGFYIQNVLASILVTTVVLLAPLLLLSVRQHRDLADA